MRFRLRVPSVATSTVESLSNKGTPVLDGRDVLVKNRWNLPAHTVAMIGRPAVWFAFDLYKWHIERDIGGHLYLLVTDEDTSQAAIVEAGPRNPNGTGALVPFNYPEETFAERHISDFDPEIIPPPHGVSAAFFADSVRAMHRAYDGDQRYLAIEIPFLRVGRDSNSYAIGVLLACGVDPRAIPKGPKKAIRRELSGYPGAEDPVPKANFGVYFGAPTPLDGGAAELAYHASDGGVTVVAVGGEPNGRVRLGDGTFVGLDNLGRIIFSPDDARAHGMPTRKTEPPQHIRTRRRYPKHPDPAGGYISLVADGSSVPLEPGKSYRGTVVSRNDALGITTLRTDNGECTLPIADLGVELRDPKRVNELFNVGNTVTVGLHHDRHPKLIAHGSRYLPDRLRWRRLHVPRWINVVTTVAIGAAIITAAIVWIRARPS